MFLSVLTIALISRKEEDINGLLLQAGIADDILDIHFPYNGLFNMHILVKSEQFCWEESTEYQGAFVFFKSYRPHTCYLRDALLSFLFMKDNVNQESHHQMLEDSVVPYIFNIQPH